MEIGANAFNVISIWRDSKFEDQFATLRPSDAQAAAKMFEARPASC